MKKIRIAATTALLVLIASDAIAQDMAVRHGVFTAMQEVQGSQSAISSTTKRRFGVMIGRALGHAVGNSGYSYEAANLAESVAADVAPSGEAANAASNYMAMIRLKDGSEVAMKRTGSQLGVSASGAKSR